MSAVLALVAALAGSAPVAPEVRAALEVSAAPMTPEQAAAGVERFRSAVASRDARQVAALTRFPLRVNRPDGTSSQIGASREFRRQFATLFDAAGRDAVARQALATMPAGYRGLMFDGGRYWLQPVCTKPTRDGGCTSGSHALRLVAVNLTAEIAR